MACTLCLNKFQEAATKAVAIANIVQQAEDVKVEVQINVPSFLPL
jgi:hypothetical protein